MADSSVAVTAGSGTSIDTRTESTNGNHRQVVVLGDPATNDGVAPVSSTLGVSVNVTNTSIAVTDNGGSLTVDGTVAISGSVAVTDNAGSLTVDGTITASNTSGDVAHDGVDSGNPVKVGHKAYELDGTEPGTAVAEGDRTNSISDKYGRVYVETAHPRFWHVSADYASAQTNTSIKAAPGAGVALYITDILISNGATAGNITLLDGSGGTVVFEVYPAVNGGASYVPRNPIKLTDNTALVITSTTVTTHSVNISGFID